MKQPCVYILASERNGTLYIGVTGNLLRRNLEHKCGLVKGFTYKHDVKRLVWYELHETFESAISREKNLKKWRRIWKVDLIERFNPEWDDLFGFVAGSPPARG